jgi:hypothetical protein
MTRTFFIPGVDEASTGGLVFRRHSNKTHTVLSGANTLYDYTSSEHPNL